MNPANLRSALRLYGLLFLPALLSAQELPRLHSVDVHPDRTVTFEYRAASAAAVSVVLDETGKPITMTKNSDGVWSATTAPLTPEIYSYHFVADGNDRLDPYNPRVTPSLISLSNMFTVAGTPAQPWEITNVPHGVVDHHIYNTSVEVGLKDNQSDYYVYTPPNYDAKRKKPYPVLYLLHGWSDDASGWTSVGQAQLILDNLLAQEKIKPMVVVMPLGYGDMSFVSDHRMWDSAATVDHNTSLFTKALLTEVLPQVESQYNVSRRREERAIAGLSMGGLESVTTGLEHPDIFAWVGGFSSAVQHPSYQKQLESLDPKAANLKLLWIACGTDDALIEPNRKLVSWLKTKEMPVTEIETPGRHSWQVWRDNLTNFAPLLFQGK